MRGRRAVLTTSIRAMKKDSQRGVAAGRNEAKKPVNLEYRNSRRGVSQKMRA